MTISLPQPFGADLGTSPLTVVRDLPEILRPVPSTPAGTPDCVAIGPFAVCDRAQSEVVEDIVVGALEAPSRSQAWVTYALHVGGLNSRREASFVQAMAEADLVYADGMSVVMLARMAGATRIERAGTTDIGWNVLARLSEELGRPARVALVGGPDGLTCRAGEVLAEKAGVEIVLAEHGYHEDWEPVLARLADSGCDLLFVGLGAPVEMAWVAEHRDALPACAVMTCGGWFGFITEIEKRAPEWACRSGLEWTFRLAQSPRRLWRRYATGALSMLALAVTMNAAASAMPSSGGPAALESGDAQVIDLR